MLDMNIQLLIALIAEYDFSESGVGQDIRLFITKK